MLVCLSVCMCVYLCVHSRISPHNLIKCGPIVTKLYIEIATRYLKRQKISMALAKGQVHHNL